MSAKKQTKEDLTKSDQVINEIADSEQTYHDILAELIESYVKTIRAISSGQKGQEAADALGLSAAEVESIFGWRLEEIISVSNNLLSKLEVVTLVRSEPITGEGRVGLVADAFVEITPELHVYAPFVSAHKSSLNTLEKALQALNAKGTKAGGLGAQLLRQRSDKGVGMTFTKLWDVVSNASPRLKGQTLQSLLIMPVQRVPRYKLLIRELVKETPADHPARPALDEAAELIGAAAKQINEALRQHEKLGKFFGEVSCRVSLAAWLLAHVQHRTRPHKTTPPFTPHPNATGRNAQPDHVKRQEGWQGRQEGGLEH